MKFQKMRYTVLLTALLISMVCFADDFTLRGKVVDEEEHALELVTVSCPAQGKVTIGLCHKETRVQKSEKTTAGADRDASDEGPEGGDGDPATPTDGTDAATGRKRPETDT